MASSTRIIEGSISQYTGGGGQSSCTSIATFATLSLLPILDAAALESITPVMIDRLVREGIAMHGAKEHVSCSDVIDSPPFAGWTNYLLFETPRSSGDPGAINAIIKEAYGLRDGFDPARYRGVVLTSRMESFLVGLPPPGSEHPFMLFDSHTRGESRARVVLFPTTAALNTYIYDTIFPASSSEGLPPDYLGIDATVLQGPGGGDGGAGAAAAPANDAFFRSSSSSFGGGAGSGSAAPANSAFFRSSSSSGGAGGAAAAAAVTPRIPPLVFEPGDVHDSMILVGKKTALTDLLSEIELNAEMSGKPELLTNDTYLQLVAAVDDISPALLTNPALLKELNDNISILMPLIQDLRNVFSGGGRRRSLRRRSRRAGRRSRRVRRRRATRRKDLS